MKLIHGDCLQEMKQIPDGSIDLVLADPPYGTTACKWDSIIPLEPMWEQVWRVLKPNGAAVFTASQPFTTALIGSNYRNYKVSYVWNKVNRVSGFLNSNKQPLRIHEDVCVFYRKQPTYNPQMVEGVPYKSISSGNKSKNYGKQTDKVQTINEGYRYPTTIISIKADNRGIEGRIHPTQKPVALMEYLIKTYTNEGDIVLDFCMGSGSTGIACRNLKRDFIGIELDEEYFKAAKERLSQRILE